MSRLASMAVGLGAMIAMAGPAQAAPAGDEVWDYPLAQGNYTTSTDFYWVFFRTPDGRACGIGPNGGPVGCDAVAADAPPGANQTYVISWGPAEYRHSQTKTFTRDVDVLPAGQRLQNNGASCAVDYRNAVHCMTYGEHGFILSAANGVFW